MKTIKRALALALSAALTLALCACDVGVTRDDATAYIQGELDATYKGDYHQDYLDLLEDMTEEDAKEQYEANVAAEAEKLLYFLGAEYPDDAVTAKAEELVAEIYSHAQYTVGKADKLDNEDFAVEVRLSPIEIISLLEENAGADTWDAACADAGITTQEQMDATTDEEYAALDAAYAAAMLKQVEELLPWLEYGEEQVVMLQLKLGEDNYYSLVDTGWKTLDGMMIDYNGEYIG